MPAWAQAVADGGGASVRLPPAGRTVNSTYWTDRTGLRWAHQCSRELTWHDDQTVPGQTEIKMYTFSSRHPGQRPRRTLRAVAIAARAAGALTATTWAAVATSGELQSRSASGGD